MDQDQLIDAPLEKKEEQSNESKDEGLFEITDLNDIDDKMARGIAKKIFTAGKRSEKSRSVVIKDIGNSLKEAGKLNDGIEKNIKEIRELIV